MIMIEKQKDIDLVVIAYSYADLYGNIMIFISIIGRERIFSSINDLNKSL
jgi:hypothetical protein